MSNDKVQAAMHGSQPQFAFGQWVRVNSPKQPFHHNRVGQVDGIKNTSLFPYLIRFDDGDSYASFDAWELEPAEEPPLPKVDHWTPTPGEILMSLGIILAIVLIFVFVTIYYRL